MKLSPSRSLAIAMLTLFTLLLAACGGGTKNGGGTIGGGDPTAKTTLSVTIELRNGSGNAVSRLTFSESVQAVAKVMQTVTATGPNGPYTSTRVAQNVQVTFQTTGGQLNPSSGSVLTDSEGRARITLVAGNTAGAFQLQASAAAENASPGTAALAYSIDRTLVGGLSVEILDQAGQSQSILRAGDVYTIRARATHAVQDINNPNSPGTPAPLANVEVTIASDGGTFDPTNGKALSDAAGEAKVQFEAALKNGAFQMAASATIDGQPVTQSIPYTVKIPQLRIGFGSPFTNGALRLSPSEIDAGGESIITATVLDEDDKPFLTPVQIAFSSSCTTLGSSSLPSPVRTDAGQIVTSYRARGCLGSDIIRARLLLEGQTVPAAAEATLRIRPPSEVALTFTETNHSVIATRGMATDSIPETADVSFRVADLAGNPIAGSVVNFALSSDAGGAVLTPTSAVSGPDGKVTTTVRSGTATQQVLVIATAPSARASAQSAAITITNSRPVQGALSLSVGTLNLEAFGVDGVPNPVTVRVAGRDGSPVPDGTAVRFSVAGGSITPSCTTSNGACSVTMTSQNPRPANGRIAILASTIGDERFTDLNSNGLYDLHEPFVDSTEAWRDDNENGKYDPGEPFLDDNGNGRWDAGNALYDGSACASGCGRSWISVFGQSTVVYSTSQANIIISPNPIDIHPGETRSVSVFISDMNGNMMAEGTSVQLTATGAELTADQYTIADTNSRGPYVARATLKGDETPGNGVLNVSVTSKGGVVSTATATIRNTLPSASTSGNGVVQTMFVNPSDIALSPGETREFPVYVTLDTISHQPVGGVTPFVKCEDGAEWATLELAAPAQASNMDGMSTLKLRAKAGSTQGSVAQCVIKAGFAAGAVTVRVADPAHR